MTHTKFKGPGQWRSQAAELERLDNDEASEVESEDEHEPARSGAGQSSSEEAG